MKQIAIGTVGQCANDTRGICRLLLILSLPLIAVRLDWVALLILGLFTAALALLGRYRSSCQGGSREVRFEFRDLCFGVLLPLVPFIDAQLPLCLAAIYLLSIPVGSLELGALPSRERGAASNKIVRVLRSFSGREPLLWLLIAWTLAIFVTRAPFADLSFILSIGDRSIWEKIGLARDNLVLVRGELFDCLIITLRWAVLLGFIGSASALGFSRLRAALQGAVVGFALAAAVATLAALDSRLVLNLGAFLPATEQYWQSQGRIAATFTDPNGLGLFAFLIICVLIWLAASSRSIRERCAYIAILPVAAVMAIFAGSRSFVLGVVVLGVVALIGSSIRWARLVLASAFLFWVSWNGLAMLRPNVAERIKSEVPQAIERVIEMGEVFDARSNLKSREIFLKIGMAIWQDHPIFGVGPGRFRNLTPIYSERLGLNTGLWNDNSNNFYLGVLAELGVLGFLLLALTVGCYRFNTPSTTSSFAVLKYAVIAFALLLLTGPHLESNEVAVLFGLLLALVLERRSTGWDLKLLCERGAGRVLSGVAVLLVLLGVLNTALFQSWGLYNFERDGHGFFRWTHSRAQVMLRCDRQASRAELRLEGVSADGAGPAIVLSPEIGEPQLVRLRSGVPRTIYLDCRAAALYPLQSTEQSKPTKIGLSSMRVGVDVLRPLYPVLDLGSQDPRVLGIKIRGLDLE